MSIDLSALGDMTYGLYIVGAHDGSSKVNAMIANSVFQVTASPCKIAACINKQALTHSYIQKSGWFSVQVIKEDADMVFIGNFGFRTGKDFDKFAKYKWQPTENKLPCALENVLSILEIKVAQVVDFGTHTMFVGDMLASRVLDEGAPLTYKYYQRVMCGKTPRGATTFKG